MSLPPILQNLEIPVIAAPLFIVSGPELVIAQCKAGIVGSFPALNARPKEELEKWIIRIKLELEQFQKENPDKKVAPFAVNQICHGSNNRLEHDMEICARVVMPEGYRLLLSFQKLENFLMARFSPQGLLLMAILFLARWVLALTLLISERVLSRQKKPMRQKSIKMKLSSLLARTLFTLHFSRVFTEIT